MPASLYNGAARHIATRKEVMSAMTTQKIKLTAFSHGAG
jgi:hypothetical protein